MKTSKVILISYFSFIGLAILSFTIMGFVHKDKSLKDVLSSEKHETVDEALPSFSHINVKEGCKVKIQTGEKTLYSYSQLKEEDSEKPSLEVKNDTLFVYNSVKTTTIITNKLKSVNAVNSDVVITDLKLDELKLSAYSADVRIWNNVDISILQVILNHNSKLNGWDFKVEKVIMDINESKFNGRSEQRIKEASGNIYAKSEVYLPTVGSLRLDVDESSVLRIH